MIHHIVLFKFLDSVSEKDKLSISEALMSMKEKIQEISSMSVGNNFSDRSQGYDFALSVFLPSKEALESYQQNAFHQAIVADHIRPHVEKTLAVDYVF